MAAAYAAKSVVSQFVSSMSASADVLALAKIDHRNLILRKILIIVNLYTYLYFLLILVLPEMLYVSNTYY